VLLPTANWPQHDGKTRNIGQIRANNLPQALRDTRCFFAGARHGNAVGFRIDCKVAAVNGGAFPLVFVRFFACFTALAADVSDYQNHPHDLCPYKFCGLPVPVLPDGYRVALAQPQGGADYTACH
jgi:hypothetical protein